MALPSLPMITVVIYLLLSSRLSHLIFIYLLVYFSKNEIKFIFNQLNFVCYLCIYYFCIFYCYLFNFVAFNPPFEKFYLIPVYFYCFLIYVRWISFFWTVYNLSCVCLCSYIYYEHITEYTIIYEVFKTGSYSLQESRLM